MSAWAATLGTQRRIDALVVVLQLLDEVVDSPRANRFAVPNVKRIAHDVEHPLLLVRFFHEGIVDELGAVDPRLRVVDGPRDQHDPRPDNAGVRYPLGAGHSDTVVGQRLPSHRADELECLCGLGRISVCHAVKLTGPATYSVVAVPTERVNPQRPRINTRQLVWIQERNSAEGATRPPRCE